MTGLEIEIGKRILEVFAKQANEHNKRANECKRQDMRSCENYLEAARLAITGLEEEYDQILVQAKNCNLDEPEQIRELSTRIDAYLMVDVLRPELQAAIAGLGKCRNTLNEDAERFLLWLWPPTKHKRQEAITKFDALLSNLNNYLHMLDAQGLTELKLGTGVGAISLGEIQTYLRSRPPGNIDPYGLARLVIKFQRDLSKDHLLDHVTRIRETIHDLRSAFR